MATLDYDAALEVTEKIKDIASKDMWDFIYRGNTSTCKVLDDLWEKNVRKNAKKYYKDCGPIADFKGLAKNKAVIGIGAGPSLKNNIDVLRALSLEDGVKPFHQQDFVLIASNHQFKPCLKKGIIPHFVILCDAGNHLIDQLCKDIPENGQSTILLASLQASPKIIKKWLQQGRKIKFFVGASKNILEIATKLIKQEEEEIGTIQGGNVLNNIWTLACTHLKSTVFMSVGNDLSFERKNSVEEQRKVFYQDGDYSTNLASKRDEAVQQYDWMGFSFYDNVVSLNSTPLIKLSPVRTTGQFLIYKIWLETMVAMNAAKNQTFRYYNCSEGGIAGVKCKAEKGQAMFDKNNWFLLDDILPKRWCTKRLKDAVIEFMAAKIIMRQGINEANFIRKPQQMSTLQ